MSLRPRLLDTIRDHYVRPIAEALSGRRPVASLDALLAPEASTWLQRRRAHLDLDPIRLAAGRFRILGTATTGRIEVAAALPRNGGGVEALALQMRSDRLVHGIGAPGLERRAVHRRGLVHAPERPGMRRPPAVRLASQPELRGHALPPIR